uniref:Uncharacterized protein n=1 Tax=Canis lupus familiaris TaxID=9615 RepID=A0A8C0NSE8_CANLF
MELGRAIMKVAHNSTKIYLIERESTHGTSPGVDVGINNHGKGVKMELKKRKNFQLETQIICGNRIKFFLRDESFPLNSFLLKLESKRKEKKRKWEKGKGKGKERERGRDTGRGRRSPTR